MPSYIVSYDLRKVRNYDGLTKALRDGNFVSPLESVWLGNSTHNAGGLRDVLKSYMDADDGILVLELKHGSGWALSKVNDQKAVTDWIRTNVAP
ncbi:hypothetical protein [Paracoccus marcusii]|uniref:SinR-like protein n=1 Tax=Paracoccus marcusii TaxID=59779 RepID=A0ABY7UNZ4_9RHOB|nr:hypothetical protein [Paracoccus marcusii]WDA11656.1 hypothetical protein PRL19_10125 [Paracoccus marcusii]